MRQGDIILSGCIICSIEYGHVISIVLVITDTGRHVIFTVISVFIKVSLFCSMLLTLIQVLFVIVCLLCSRFVVTFFLTSFYGLSTFLEFQVCFVAGSCSSSSESSSLLHACFVVGLLLPSSLLSSMVSALLGPLEYPW